MQPVDCRPAVGVPSYMGNGGDFAAIEDLLDIIVV